MPNTYLEEKFEVELEIRCDKEKGNIRAFVGKTELKDFGEHEDYEELNAEIDFSKMPARFEKRIRFKILFNAEGYASYSRGGIDFPEESSIEDVTIKYGETDITEAIDSKLKEKIEEKLFERYMENR